MKSFFPSLYKFILGMFFFGLAFFANPIEGYCANPNYGNASDSFNFSISTDTYSWNSDPTSKNIVINGPLYQYGLVPFSSFDISFDINYTVAGINSNPHFSLFGGYEVYVLFSSSDNAAYSKFLGTIFTSSSFLDSSTDSFHYTFNNVSVDGVPTGFRVVPVGAFNISNFSSNFTQTGSLGSSTITNSSPISGTVYFGYFASFYNFNFDSSSDSSGGSTVINNTSSNLVPIGYSSLNFGLNGSTYFLGASRIFEPSYLSPLMFSYDFANSVQGVVSSAPLTLAMGGYDSQLNTAHASPIAVIGDTRAGEYELTIALCLTNSPSSSQLSALTNLSNWGFEFNRGYSGQQFSLPSNTRVSYTNFTDSKTGYVYTSVYFYFTTPDYFDSFLIRKAPTLNNIRVGAFAFNKYTGTISDQLNQSSEQWSYQNPSHDSFLSANSSAASTVSAFSNIESEAFSNLDTAMSGAGVNDFNINVISTPLATVSAMINQTYNILPDVVKWLLLAILVIGIFAAIISSNNYVNKDP